MNYIKDKTGRLYESYSDEEYHACVEFVGSSTLKKIANDRSTDYLFLEPGRKIEFELGTAFHALVQDKATGKGEFEELYYLTQMKCRPLNIFDRIESLRAGREPKGDFENELVENNYRFPLKLDEWEMIRQMAFNLFQAEFRGLNVGDCMANSTIEKPFFWENGFKKKCKPDFYFFIEDTIYLFDLKTYGKEVESFGWDFQRSGYWVQACHYREGLKSHYPEHNIKPMSFCVSSKKEPYLSQIYPLDIDERLVESIEFDYQLLCDKYLKWAEGGKVKKGYLDDEGKLFYKIQE